MIFSVKKFSLRNSQQVITVKVTFREREKVESWLYFFVSEQERSKEVRKREVKKEARERKREGRKEQRGREKERKERERGREK